jgi:hypothetical protein
MNDSKAIQDLKSTVSLAREAYLANPGIPAGKTQIPVLEEKLGICDSRLSELEAENANQSKDKGKGKANESRFSE